jgi:hypothetical protein
MSEPSTIPMPPARNPAPRRRETVDAALALPRYEVRSTYHGPGDPELEIWQLPSPATPHLRSATRIAGLRGRNLEFVESRVVRRLKAAGLPSDRILGARQLPGHREGWALAEDHALTLALLFRVLAPMSSRENLRAVVEGIEHMGKEEASYWLGMTLHRLRYRRVCAALRLLFTEPRPKKKVTHG